MEKETNNETYKPQMGYIGLDKEMKSSLSPTSVEVFEIGKVYYKDNKENPKLCSTDGYHYCQELEDVFKHYKNNGENRFFKIEVLGNFTHGLGSNKKSITTCFRLVSEITKEELEKIQAVKETADLESKFNLKEVRFLQEQNPYCHVGGSVALWLHGLSLKRWKSGSSDLDMVVPFFFQWSKSTEMDIDYKDAKASGNDFDETFILNSIKVDVKIDNAQRYEIIEKNGFKYKVSSLETILEAKLRYSMNGQTKHKEDIRELLGLKNK
jgi:hypothetical protein